MQEQVIALIHLINTDQLDLLSELTSTIIYNSLFLCEKSTTYLSILYQLIFHTYKYNPTAACHILNGFIEFGYSANGMLYKPMIDYFVVEAFTGLFEIGGWSVLKPCLMVLCDSNPNYLNDSLFQHILAQIVSQLKQDENDMLYSSNLCYNLPREKSFSWGWFSYDLTRAYYSKNKIPTPKELRKYMMLYRKLLTSLRKNALNNLVYQPDTQGKIEENWTDLLNALCHYKWAGDIIKNVINNDDDVPEPMPEPVLVSHEEPMPHEEPVPHEEPELVPMPEPELVPMPEPVIVNEKNTSWLSWFGFA